MRRVRHGRTSRHIQRKARLELRVGVSMYTLMEQGRRKEMFAEIVR